MDRQRYVALLRGINVGGRNLVPMTALRAAFEESGLDDVRTYIQSGNVLFRTAEPAATLEDRIEEALEARFATRLVVVVRSHAQLRSIVTSAPAGFGARPDTFHSDVIFLKSPLSAREAMKALDLREGVDQAWPGRGVVYFARLSERLSASRLSRVTARREYQRMTIRSWTTTTKLLALADG